LLTRDLIQFSADCVLRTSFAVSIMTIALDTPETAGIVSQKPYLYDILTT